MVILFFILGACMGSFSLCIAMRLLKGQSFIYGRSYCPVCYHKLSIFDLFPIISWFFLKGRCRYCGKKIDLIYPAFELLFGSMAIILFMKIQNPYLSMLFIILCSVLFVISYIDAYTMYIYDNCLGCLFMFSFMIVLYQKNSYIYYLLCELIIVLPLYALSKLYKQSVGEGDLFILAILCPILGIKKSLFMLYFASTLGCIYAFSLKKTWKNCIPFVPFLSIGFLLSFLLIT